jgi:hypothetical protein
MGPTVFPIPAISPLGTDIAAGLGYCQTAKPGGVDLADVDLTIGTSAGSIVGSVTSVPEP